MRLRTGTRALGRAAALVLGNLWTLPNTALGFLVGLAFTWDLPRLDRRHGYVSFASGRGISPLVSRSGRSATTFGSVVVFWSPECAGIPAFRVHEAVHVRQYLILGPLFIPLYLVLVPFTGWRRNHPLERPAYRAGENAP